MCCSGGGLSVEEDEDEEVCFTLSKCLTTDVWPLNDAHTRAENPCWSISSSVPCESKDFTCFTLPLAAAFCNGVFGGCNRLAMVLNTRVGLEEFDFSGDGVELAPPVSEGASVATVAA